MPKYRSRQLRWDGFANHTHAVQFLQKQQFDDPLYKTHFRDRAKGWLDGTSSPPVKLGTRALRLIAHTHPRHVAAAIMSEAKLHSKGTDVGGGIGEAIQTIGRAARNALGIPKILEWFGHKGYEKKRIPREAQIFAAAVSATYKDIDERPDKLYGLTRLPEYDSDRLSVWKEPNGDYFVSVHGTKMTAHDLGQDAAILAGQPVTNKEVTDVITKLVNEGHRVDVGGHSLATQYLTNLPMDIQERIDEVYLFNPASSPFMSNSYLDEIANERSNYHYFLNPSDMVSSGLYNRITNETIKNQAYIGGYRWSPLAAHGLEQWMAEIAELDEEDVARNYEQTAVHDDDRAWYRVHLQGVAKEQARWEARERELNEQRGEEREAAQEAQDARQRELAPYITQQAGVVPQGVLVV